MELAELVAARGPQGMRTEDLRGLPRQELVRRALEAVSGRRVTHMPRERGVGTAGSGGGGLGAPARLTPPNDVPRPVARGDRRKRAVLVGVSYRGTSSQLQGCANDTGFMRHLLRTRWGFAEDEVLLLNEDQANPFQIPTRANILRAIEWLTSGLVACDSLVFLFSGHGSQVPDRTGEEWDGRCETLCPLDHRAAGMISDKELSARLVQPLPRGTRLLALVDSCHSGSILDLPYQVTPLEDGSLSTWLQAQRVFKSTAGGRVVCISGCEDGQTSADTRALSGGAAATGAMLYSFVAAVERGQASTFGALLQSMYATIRQGLQGAGAAIVLGGFALPLPAALGVGAVQTPQLSASAMFDLARPFEI